MWKEFNLINSFTLECSFCGPTSGVYKDCHFTITLLKDLGKHFCRTLVDYSCKEQKVKEAIQELEVLFPPSKAEEGLIMQFVQNEKAEPKQAEGGRASHNYNGYFGGPDQEDDGTTGDDKNGKGKPGKKKQGKTHQVKK